MMDRKIIMGVLALLMIVSLMFVIQGVNMHSKVEIEEAKFHQIQSKYFIQDKETRDNAQTSSTLNKQLVEIKNYPSELSKLKLIGAGKILLGIYILLFGILAALVIMPFRLAKLLDKKRK